MREIKFRAWDKEEQKMYRVTMLDFPEWNVSVKNGEEFYKNGDRNSFKNSESDRCILMQYTGLKDKNGVEIYDGDIVEWICGSPMVDLDFGTSVIVFDYDGINLRTTNERAIKVIGNIYENQELLKDE